MAFLAVPVAQYLGAAVTGSLAGAAAWGTAAAGLTTLGSIGSAVSAIGGLVSSSSSSRADEFNARTMQQNSLIAQQTAEENARRQRILNQKEQGSIKAGFAASGLKMEGSPEDLIGESMINGELAVADILNQGKRQALDFASQANLAKASAKFTKTGSFLSAGGSLLKAAGSFGSAIKVA